MSGEVTNEDRAGWAAEAVWAFGQQTNQRDCDIDDPEMVREVVGDLICDLMHLAYQCQPGLEKLVLDRGRMHFEFEIMEDEEEG